MRPLVLLLLLLACGFTPRNILAQSAIEPVDQRDGEGVIVRLTEGADAQLIQRALGDWLLSPVRPLGFGLYHALVAEADLALAQERLRETPGVQYAGPNRRVQLRNSKPNDPEYSKQWHHSLLGSERAWAIATGGVTPDGFPIVAAIMDAGFERTHEDIQPALWINPGEIPDDGIDNDNNGFVDDYDGYNPKLLNGAVPVHTHGNSVIGYIGAAGDNGIGVTGINWDARMMLIGPTLFEAEMIAGFHFVYRWRVRFNETQGQEGAFIPVINMSLGFERQTPQSIPWMCPLMDSLYQAGIVVVAASPNEGVDIGVVGDMPCLCPTPNIICVTNTTRDDNLVSNAGYSKTFVHLAAPGFNSFTTRLTNNGSYGNFSGTSAAAPMVSGVVALLAAMPCDSVHQMLFNKPELAAAYLRQAVLDGVVPIKDLKDLTATGGRLSIWSDKGIGAVPALASLCNSSEGPIDALQIRPNPANTVATLILRSPGNNPVPVRVYNMLGQVLWEESYLPTTFAPKVVELPTAYWPAGLYLITVGDGRDIRSAKMLVHH